MKLFKTSQLICLLLLGLFTNSQAQDSAAAKKADQLVSALVTKNQAAGAGAAYSENGEIKWMGTSGYAHIEKQIPFTETTITRTASIAKPMTAIAVMQLVEQGKVDLNASIQTYIPDFPQKSKKPILVKHLLSHTSGIGAYKNVKEMNSTIHYTQLSDALSVFKNRKLRFEPGSEFYYTTYGYVVLGVLIEQVSGMSFEAYIAEHIWKKAGMEYTSVEHFDQEYANKSALYHIKKGKKIWRPENDLSNRMPGGGFQTTIGDIIKFGNAVLNHTLIKESTLEQMLEIQSLEKKGNPYGYGWFLYGAAPHKNAVIGHSGAQRGCSTQLFINRHRKTVTVVLSNTSGGGGEVTGAAVYILQAFQQAMDAKKG